MKPLIGISVRIYDKISHSVRAVYSDAIRSAGGIPVLVPMPLTEDFEQYVQALDGYLIPGGWDMNALLFGEEPHPTVKTMSRAVDVAEMNMIRMFHAAKKPVMGICRGHQVINVCFGGTLYQDIPSQTDSNIGHYQDANYRAEATHSVRIEQDSRLAAILAKERIEVNSLHHQSVKTPGEGLRVVARAADGIVEALEDAEGLVMGYQWHPEEMCQSSEDAPKLFRDFVDRCRAAREALK